MTKLTTVTPAKWESTEAWMDRWWNANRHLVEPGRHIARSAGSPLSRERRKAELECRP